MLPKTFGAVSAIFFSLIVFAISTSAATTEVELTFHDQDLSIKGQLAGFIDDAYVIRTGNGVLHVPATLVACIGPVCEQVAANQPAG